MYKQKIGKKGEEIASKYLEKNNYNILERNFRCLQGEIDIIAYDKQNKYLVFFEVKTRTNFKYGFPGDAVDSNKRRHILSSVKYYLYSRKLENALVRIDVLEVILLNGKWRLRHLRDVISEG